MSGSPPLPAVLGAAADPDAPGAPGVPARLPAAYGTQSDAPLGATPAAVRAWFDAALNSAIPDADGTLATAQQTAKILARHAKADNTRRAYRAGVRAWCAWCGRYGLIPLPARPADIAAFLAAERYRPDGEKPLAANTLRLQGRRDRLPALPRRLPLPHRHGGGHRDFRWARPAGQAGRPGSQAETRGQDRHPARDPGADRRRPARAARPGAAAAGLRRSLPSRRTRPDRGRGSRGGRAWAAHHPALLEGRPRKQRRAGRHPVRHERLCPVRALQRWRDAAGITTGPLFRRIWATPRPKDAPQDWKPIHVVGLAAVDPGTIARIVKARGKVAGFDAKALGGHSLKRGAMNTAKDRRVHPAQLKQLGRHRSYATLAAYIEEGDLFEDNALNGVL